MSLLQKTQNYLLFLGVFCLLMTARQAVCAVGPEADRPLRLGLLPYLSSQKLIATYAPLANFLEQRLGRKILLVTAPDFASYFRRSTQGRYDIYFTAPHFAAYAEMNYQHRRLVRPKRNLRGTFVVPVGSEISQIEDMRGKTLATPDNLAVLTIVAENMLQEHGLVPGHSVFIHYAASHNNAIATVLEGRSDAAIALSAFYDRLDEARQARVKVVSMTPAIPHAMFMALPAMQPELYRLILAAMLDFSKSEEGRVFFDVTAFINFVEISDTDMSQMKPFAQKIDERVR